MTDYELQALEAPLPPEARIVDDGLDGFNRQAANLDGVRPLACFARLDSGEVACEFAGFRDGVTKFIMCRGLA